MSQHAQAPPRLLDVRLAEGVYAAAVAGKRQTVLSAVSAIEDATLPGLIEYLCLRRTRGEELGLPAVPERVAQSDLGRSLQRVVCPFGLRQSGGFIPNTGVNPLPSEFFVLRGEQDYSSHAYKLFETRWARACESLGFRERRAALHLALSAMVENAVLHADSQEGVLVGYRLQADAALFTVADLGRGVLASLRTNDDYSYLQHHREALRLAFRTGVSRLGVGNGFGFHQLFKALAHQYGTLRFRTGDVCVTMDGQDFSADLGQETFPEAITGMRVSVCCRRSPAAQAASAAL
jgi:hypothetical protein